MSSRSRARTSTRSLRSAVKLFRRMEVRSKERSWCCESRALRESVAKSTKYIYVKDRHLLRTRDVFARTTTDAKGKFEFREAKSPAFPKAWTNSTRADVVAAHETLGVGQVSLASNTERQRRDLDVTVVLRPTNPVSGRFVTPKNAPIENAIVSIERLFRLNTRIIGNDGFDLQTSQLTPRTETDAEGRFRLTGIPEGFAASIWLSHPEWIDRYAVIATSQDVPLGKQPDRIGYVGAADVLGVPAEVVADPGHSIIVQVLDPDGKPVHDVRVSITRLASFVDRRIMTESFTFGSGRTRSNVTEHVGRVHPRCMLGRQQSQACCRRLKIFRLTICWRGNRSRSN